MVKVENLVKRYHVGKGESVDALKDVSFEVADGEFLTLLGPSGCGKSTTLRCIAGLETPDGGRITLDNAVVVDGARAVPPYKRDIGMVFQSYAVWPHMTVGDNVAYPLRHCRHRQQARRIPKGQLRDRVEEALESVGLAGYSSRLVNELSGGQQQRVAVARAIVGNARLLLLDEPLSNLDAQLRRQMRHELRRLAKQHRLTTIYVTHDQAEALTMSDRVIVMRRGVIEQAGTPLEIYNTPTNQFTAEFLGNISMVDGRLTGVRERGLVEVAFDHADDGGDDSVPGTLLGRPVGDIGVEAGAHVKVGIRSHGAQMFPRDAAPLVDDRRQMAATVLDVHFLGDRWEFVLRLANGVEMTLRTEQELDFANEENLRVVVCFDPQRIYVFG